ncbi:MAG: DUF6591 domain-containing protein [Coriobacteriales bacterium]|jgi:Skp family chaperone for outer membrane proteins
MKKKFLPLFAVLFAFVFALALAGCGGSSDKAADDTASDAGAAVEQAADDATADAAAADDKYADVNADLKAIGDRLLPLSDEFCETVEQAKTADDPSELIAKANSLSGELNEISADIQKIDQSTLTDADLAYLNDVLMPSLNKMLDSATDMLDLI